MKKYFTILLIIPVIAFVYFLPMFFMKPQASGRITDSEIISCKNKSNSIYFVPAGEKWIAIDAGSKISITKKEMAILKINPEKVTAVFLTHTDYDHVASIPLFSNASVYIGKDEKQMIDGRTKRNLFQKNKLPESNCTLICLDNRETLNINGITVKAIFSEGHTKGHTLYDINGKYLFTGDAFMPGNKDLKIHPYTMNKKIAKKTIDSIKKDLHKYKLVLTAHYGIVNISE